MLHSRIAPRKGPLTIWALAAALIAVPLHLAKAADAAPCQLRRVAGFDIHFNAAGLPSVPLTVAGQTRPFVVGISNTFSSLFDGKAKAMNIKLGRIANAPPRKYLALGAESPAVAPVKDFKIGPLPVPNYSFMIDPDDVNAPDEAGVLGPDILGLFDVDLDFAKGKLNLIEPNTCGSGVVYWGGPFVQIPIKFKGTNGLKFDDNNIFIDGKLDNADVHIVIDSRSPKSYILRQQATGLFDWHGVPEGAKKVEPLKFPDYKWEEDTYSYPFKTLNLGGLVINNPQVLLWSPSGPVQTKTGLDMVVGMDVIRLLHLYISYKQQTLYISPAPPPFSPSASAPAPN